MAEGEKSYRVLGVTTTDEIPGWDRKPPKWTELVEAVLALEPGQTMVVEFDDEETARRAQSAVRDTVHMKTREVTVRTRLARPDSKRKNWTLYLARVHPSTYSKK